MKVLVLSIFILLMNCNVWAMGFVSDDDKERIEGQHTEEICYEDGNAEPGTFDHVYREIEYLHRLLEQKYDMYNNEHISDITENIINSKKFKGGVSSIIIEKMVNGYVKNDHLKQKSTEIIDEYLEKNVHFKEEITKIVGEHFEKKILDYGLAAVNYEKYIALRDKIQRYFNINTYEVTDLSSEPEIGYTAITNCANYRPSKYPKGTWFLPTNDVLDSFYNAGFITRENHEEKEWAARRGDQAIVLRRYNPNNSSVENYYYTGYTDKKKAYYRCARYKVNN